MKVRISYTLEIFDDGTMYVLSYEDSNLKHDEFTSSSLADCIAQLQAWEAKRLS